MEFLRFGSTIPGSYWGCCACCIIQNFKVDPKAKASIQLVGGDGGNPINHPKGGSMFAGPTWEDIFWQRLRIGTFSQRDMPNHAFLAIITEWQIKNSPGKEWLAILKQAGFEFMRTVSNSVYTGSTIEPTDSPHGNEGANHIFMLVRNIGTNGQVNPFVPPVEWQALPKVKTEAWEWLPQGSDQLPELTKKQMAEDKAVWNSHQPKPFLTEAELVETGAPVILAGLRSENKQEPKATREARNAAKGKTAQAPLRPAGTTSPVSF